jgi:hypothetical protein
MVSVGLLVLKQHYLLPATSTGFKECLAAFWLPYQPQLKRWRQHQQSFFGCGLETGFTSWYETRSISGDITSYGYVG